MSWVIFGLALAVACPVSMWLLVPGGSKAQPISSSDDEVARVRAEVDQLQAAQRDATPSAARTFPRPM